MKTYVLLRYHNFQKNLMETDFELNNQKNMTLKSLDYSSFQRFECGADFNTNEVYDAKFI